MVILRCLRPFVVSRPVSPKKFRIFTQPRPISDATSASAPSIARQFECRRLLEASSPPVESDNVKLSAWIGRFE